MNGNGFLDRLRQAARHNGARERQTDIAASLGLPVQTVNQWFTKGYMPKRELILRIARTYGVDLEWLASGEGEMLAQPSEALPADERELLRSYRSATPQTRQLLRSMARAARKSVFFLAATIPPLLSPSNAEAGVLHNTYASTSAVIHIARKWLMNLALSCRRNFAM
jgi:transcriptional regulator with XRE-family HTH domain